MLIKTYKNELLVELKKLISSKTTIEKDSPEKKKQKFIPSTLGLEFQSESNLDEEQALKDYFASPVIYGKLEKMKTFWTSQSSQFPNIFRIVRKYFGIPTNSIFPEQVFSTTERFIESRVNLSHKRLEQMVMLMKNVVEFDKD